MKTHKHDTIRLNEQNKQKPIDKFHAKVKTNKKKTLTTKTFFDSIIIGSHVL